MTQYRDTHIYIDQGIQVHHMKLDRRNARYDGTDVVHSEPRSTVGDMPLIRYFPWLISGGRCWTGNFRSQVSSK